MSDKVKLDDRVWKELRAQVSEASKMHVRVGVFQDSGFADDGETTIAEIAAIHEYGAPGANIPERSFIRRTFNEQKNSLEQMMLRLARLVLSEKADVPQALNQLGAWGAAAVKNTIRKRIPPPLKQATIDRKGSSTPLVDTGQLLDSITWEVIE